MTKEKFVEVKGTRQWGYDILDHTQITREILVILECVKVDRSIGPGQVHPWTLWKATEEIAKSLADL